MTHRIDAEKCNLCGMCRMACPAGLFEPGEKAMSFVTNAAKLCVRCGHCIAACPEDAITIDELETKIFPPLTGSQIGYDEFQRLILSRRSVRRFQEKPVETEMVNRIIDAVATAPTGMGKMSANICILNGREKIEPMIEPMMEFYRKFSRGMKGTLGRVMMRTMMGKNMFIAIKKFMPMIDRMIEYFDVTGNETLTWGAPLLLIFHHSRSAISGRHDANIACTYAMLAAHALGLGTTMIGMVPPYVERTQAERKRLGIPENHAVEISLIAGYPKSKFVKGIQREVPVRWI